MKEAYCSYEISKLLKEKGFDEQCSSTYDTAVSGGKPIFYKYDVLHFFPNGMKNSDDKYGMVISAPTHQMACAWLRKKGIECVVIPIWNTISKQYRSYVLSDLGDKYKDNYDSYSDNISYEGAVEAALKYSLENLI